MEAAAPCQAIKDEPTEEPRFNDVGIYKIPLNDEDPLEFVDQLIKKHNQPPDVTYEELTTPQLWSAPFVVKVYQSRTPHLSSFGHALIQAGAQAVKEKAEPNLTGFSVNIVCFLARNQGKKSHAKWELFALTTGRANGILRAIADPQFSLRLARRLADPNKIVRARHRSLAGPIEATEEFYSLDRPCKLEEHEIRSFSSLMTSYDAYLKRGSSVHLQLGWEPDRDINVRFGKHRIKIQSKISVSECCKALQLFSDVCQGHSTQDVNQHNENDDYAWSYLDTMSRITQPATLTRLNEALTDLLWQVTVKGTACPLTVGHKCAKDFRQAAWFRVFRDSEQIKEFQHRFALKNILECFKKVGWGNKSTDKEAFAKDLSSLYVEFGGRPESFPLTDFLMGELLLNDCIYLRLDGSWYAPRGSAIAATYRQFYHLLFPSNRDCGLLLRADDEGYLPREWANKEAQVGFSIADVEAYVSVKKSERTIPKALASLQKSSICKKRPSQKFNLLDEEGYVVYPFTSRIEFLSGASRLFWERCFIAPLENLLCKRQEVSEAVSLADIATILSEIKRDLKGKLKSTKPENILRDLKTKSVHPKGKTVYTIQQLIGKKQAKEKQLPDALHRFFREAFDKYKLFAEKEEDYIRYYLDYPDYIVCDQLYPSGKEKIELFDLAFVGNRLYLYQIKQSFKKETRDACAQISTAALTLNDRAREVLEGLYGDIEEKAKTETWAAGVLQRLHQIFGKEKTEKTFVDRFRKNRADIVFVYALLDTHVCERFLSKEPDPCALEKKYSSLPDGAQLFKQRQEEKYLDEHGWPTQKFYAARRDEFEGADCEILLRTRSRFDSIMARMQVIRLKEELDQMGFGFKICQIRRPDRF